MKYVMSFAVAFALVFGLVVLNRAGNDELNAQHKEDPHKKHKEKKEDPHKEHKKDDEGKKEGDKKKEGEKKKDEEKEPVKVVDLGNKTDPVKGDEIKEGVEITAEYGGYRFKFADEKNKKRFLKRPIQYISQYSLEVADKGMLKKVDAKKYKETGTETCGAMGNEIDVEDDVYLLHRGFKIRFCCWNGCGEKFLKDPKAMYEHYGLVEKDGMLMLKADAGKHGEHKKDEGKKEDPHKGHGDNDN